MEDPAKYSSARNARVSARTANDPDFIGAEAALKRASTEAVLREDPAPYRTTQTEQRPEA